MEVKNHTGPSLTLSSPNQVFWSLSCNHFFVLLISTHYYSSSTNNILMLNCAAKICDNNCNGVTHSITHWKSPIRSWALHLIYEHTQSKSALCTDESTWRSGCHFHESTSHLQENRLNHVKMNVQKLPDLRRQRETMRGIKSYPLIQRDLYSGVGCFAYSIFHVG